MIAGTLVVDGFGQICNAMLIAYGDSFGSELAIVNQQMDRANAQMHRANEMDWQLADYSINLLKEAKAMGDDAGRRQDAAKRTYESQVEQILTIYNNTVMTVVNCIKPDWLVLDMFIDMICQWVENFGRFIKEFDNGVFSVSSNTKAILSSPTK